MAKSKRERLMCGSCNDLENECPETVSVMPHSFIDMNFLPTNRKQHFLISDGCSSNRPSGRTDLLATLPSLLSPWNKVCRKEI